MSENVVLTPEEQLSSFGDSLIQSVLKTDEVSKANRRALFGQLSPKVFRNENHIIYKVLYNFKDNGITPDAEFIEMYLTRNENVILDSGDCINIQEFADLDENPAVGYTSAVLKQYVRLMGEEPLSTEDFNLVVEKYKLVFKSLEVGRLYSQGRTILYDGIKLGRKTLMGYDDSVNYVKKGIAEIDGLLDKSTGAGFVDASEAGMQDEKEVIPEKIGDFGHIWELNKYWKGIYTGNFYSVLAPTKGGKSKICARFVHNVAVENGNNCVVWAHEGGYHAWLAQLRAIHFDYVYNKDQTDVTKKLTGVTQKTILDNAIESEEIKQYEQASRVDLFTNPNYGKLTMIDRPFVAETFIDDVITAIKLNNAKMVVIDYLQLIGTNSGARKNERIGDAYQNMLALCKKMNVAVISPAQFTQEFMKEMAASKDGSTHEVRTSGGESSEIIRTPDYNLALYASAEDLIHHKMTLMSVPSRMSGPFPPIELYIDLGVCEFCSVNQEEKG
jgi:archaellum biogenesis ATPase FlaH